MDEQQAAGERLGMALFVGTSGSRPAASPQSGEAWTRVRFSQRINAPQSWRSTTAPDDLMLRTDLPRERYRVSAANNEEGPLHPPERSACGSDVAGWGDTRPVQTPKGWPDAALSAHPADRHHLPGSFAGV